MKYSIVLDANGNAAIKEASALLESITLLAQAMSLFVAMSISEEMVDFNYCRYSLSIELPEDSKPSQFQAFGTLTIVITSIIMASKHMFLVSF